MVEIEKAWRADQTDAVLNVRNLNVEFQTEGGVVRAVQSLSFDVRAGETLAIIGESGSGKSVTAQAIMGIVPSPPGIVTAEGVWFQGVDMNRLSEPARRRLRGREISMVFQDPLTTLNPVFSVGDQIGEMFQVHKGFSRNQAREATIELMELVQIPEAARRVDDYPHQFSGGMRQRVMIAMALSLDPRLIIADEPTTALDVTIQAQVLDILRKVTRERGTSMVLITHDLGVVAETAHRVLVMYGGRVVEEGSVEDIFHAPRHPYTLGLLMSLPRLDRDLSRLLPIPGDPPSMIRLPSGCAFNPRCRMGQGRELCRTEIPDLRDVGGLSPHRSRGHFAEEVALEIEREGAAVGIEVAEGRLDAT